MTYAGQSYAMKLVAIQERLADMTRAVNEIARARLYSQQKSLVVDWGHVGDLGHVLDQLSQIEIPEHGK